MVSPLYKQMVGVSGVVVMFFCKGVIIGLLSVSLPSLRKPDSGIKLTLDEESWIVSIYFLMSFPVQCIAGFIVDKYGRKCVNVLSIVPILMTNIMMYLATNFNMLFISMVIFGVSGGGFIGSALIAEISSPKYRGLLINAKVLSVVAGSMVSHFFWKFIDWRSLVLWNCVPAVYSLVVSVTCPDSPAWLAAQGRFEECKTAFVWFRGDDDHAELQQLINSQRKVLLEKRSENRKKISYMMTTIAYLGDKCFLKTFVIGFVCITIYEVSGKTLFTVYVMDIFVMITGDKGSAHYFALAMDIQILVCISISCFTLLKFKKRTLLFSSGIAAVLFLLLLCLFSFLISKGFIPQKYSWMKLGLLLMFFMARDLGLLPASQAMWLEVFPLSHRAIGLTVSGLVYFVFTFTLTKTMPSILERFGLKVFLINAVILSLSLIFLYFCSPETSDKTLLDIENEIRGQNNVEYSVCNVDREDKNTYEKKERQDVSEHS